MRRPCIVTRYIREGQFLRLKRILRWQKGFAYPYQNFNCPFLGHVYLFWFILIKPSIVEIYYDSFCKIRLTSLNTSLNASLIILKYIKLKRSILYYNVFKCLLQISISLRKPYLLITEWFLYVVRLCNFRNFTWIIKGYKR